MIVAFRSAKERTFAERKATMTGSGRLSAALGHPHPRPLSRGESGAGGEPSSLAVGNARIENKNTLAKKSFARASLMSFGPERPLTHWHYQFFGCMNQNHLSVLVLNRRAQCPSFHSSVD
jgi:hypothetical protein